MLLTTLSMTMIAQRAISLISLLASQQQLVYRIGVAANKKKGQHLRVRLATLCVEAQLLIACFFAFVLDPAYAEHEQLCHQLLTWPRMHNIQVMFSQEMHVMLSLCVQIELQRARGASLLCGLRASCYLCFLPSPGGPSCRVSCLLQ